MKMKKLFAAIVAGAFLFTAVPVITDTTATVYAAKGGAKVSPKSAPKSAPAAPKSNAAEPAKTGPNQGAYAPSKSAKDLNKEAPKTNAAANAANTASSGIGGMMRNIGLFAGGMLLGGLLGNMLGMGGMGEIFGILANLIFIALAVGVIFWLWRKFKGRNNSNNSNPYRQNDYVNTANTNNNFEIPPIQQSTPNDGYNPKTTADRYRNR